MTRSFGSRVLNTPLLALAMAFGPTGASFAADEPLVIDWAPGEACPDFALQVKLYLSTGHLTYREFIDKNGNLARFLLAGRNFEMTFTNMTNGTTFHSKAEGAAQHWTLNADGSSTVVATGHTSISWTSSDIPPGPATARYVGRLVIDIDSSGVVGTLRSFNGQKTDICAAVS